MSRGNPSLVALLGLLAVAGYKNRDKIKQMLASTQGGPGINPRPGSQALPGGLGGLGGLLGGLGGGGLLSGGIGELVERFKRNGQGQVADSWVGTGPNQPLASDQLQKAIGPEVLDSLSQHTGLSRDELLSRLTRDLPDAVNEFTPQGRVPTETEAARFL